MVNYFTHIVAQQRLLEMPPFKLMLDYKNLTKYPTLLRVFSQHTLMYRRNALCAVIFFEKNPSCASLFGTVHLLIFRKNQPVRSF